MDNYARYAKSFENEHTKESKLMMRLECFRIALYAVQQRSVNFWNFSVGRSLPLIT